MELIRNQDFAATIAQNSPCLSNLFSSEVTPLPPPHLCWKKLKLTRYFQLRILESNFRFG